MCHRIGDTGFAVSLSSGVKKIKFKFPRVNKNHVTVDVVGRLKKDNIQIHVQSEKNKKQNKNTPIN